MMSRIRDSPIVDLLMVSLVAAEQNMQEQLIGEYNTRSASVRFAFLAALLFPAALALILANAQSLREAAWRRQAEAAADAAAAQLLGGEPTVRQLQRQKKGISATQRRNRKSKPIPTPPFDEVAASIGQQPLLRPLLWTDEQEQGTEPANVVANVDLERFCEVQSESLIPHSQVSDVTLADTSVTDVHDGQDSRPESWNNAGGVAALAMEEDHEQLFHSEKLRGAQELPLTLKANNCGSDVEGRSFTDTSVGSDIGWCPGDEEQSSGAENEIATSRCGSDCSGDAAMDDVSKLTVPEEPQTTALTIAEPFCESDEIESGSGGQPNDCTCNLGWGCMNHRTFAIHLLLAHRDLSAVAAQSPPGFEARGALATERLFQTAPRERVQHSGHRQTVTRRYQKHPLPPMVS
jgi:hypothetical protein